MEEIYDGTCASHPFCCGEFGEAGHNPSETMADVRQGALKLKDKKSISQKTGLAAFIKEARKNRIWRYATSMLAVLIVFVTVYVLILPGVTLTSSELTPTLSIANMTVTDATYDGDEYTANFYITLADITTADVDSSTTYYVVLPEGVTLENYSGSTLTGYDSNNTAAFTYTYAYAEDTGVLYAAVTFLDSYLSSAGDTLTGGWFKYSAEISSSNLDENYNIELKAGNVEYTVTYDKITVTSTDSNPAGDLSVTKSASSYDSSTNSITYTVTVSSLKGTVSDISLEDTITSTLGVSSVDVTSVQYYYTSDEWGNISQAEDVTNSVTASYSSEDKVLSMTLPALTSGAGYGSKYVIKYTVYLDDITDYSITSTVGNSAEATANTGWTGNGGGTVTSEGSANVTVSFDMLKKTGTADSDGNITWVITVNASGQNIYGLTLTDKMFSLLDQNTLINSAVSGGSYGSDWELAYDESYNIVGIKFIDSTGNQTNTNTYTITYTTGASAVWAAGTVTTTNTATLSGDGLGSDISVSKGVSTSSGSISKSKSSVSYNSDDTLDITWTITGTIPSGGITSGTTLYDYLGGSSAYTTKTTQWMTYTQMDTLRQSLYSITLTSGSSNVGTLNYGSDYTVQFYSVGTDDSTGTVGWIEMSTLTDSNTYSKYYFTAFRIVFSNDITISNSCTFSLTYTTTADRSSIDGTTVTSITYKNNVEVKGTQTLYGEASHTEGAYVIKTDGKGNTDSSTATVGSDGTLTWIVKAYVPAGCTDKYYTITDTLPKNVTLTSAKVAVSYYNCTLTSDTLSGTLYNGTVTGTITTDSNGQQVVTITVPYDSYSLLVSSGDYITVTYTCQIDESLLTTEGDDGNGGTTTVALESGASVGTFSNSVSVATSSNASFGTTSQSQTVTYSSSSGTEETTEVSKSYVWNSDSSTLTYTVIINPEEESLANGNDLSFEDILTVNHATTWGVYAQLVTGSVKFYEAVSDGDGGYTKGEELSIPWTYSQSSANYSEYISVYHIISSDSVPDATAIILEYQYEAWLDPYDEDAAEAGTAYNITGVGNSMTLEGEYKDSTSTSTSDKYTDSHFSAGIGTSTEVTITIVKVDSENYSTTLEDAVYTLYKWDGSEWTSIGTYTTDSNGMISIGKTTLGNYYATDTGYKLVETTAPDGYFLDSDTEYYFYWSGSGTDCYPDDWDSTSAHNLTKSSATEYAENTKVPDDTTTSISVDKEWVDINGTALDDSEVEATEVEVTLYRYEESELESEEATEEDTETTATATVEVKYYNSNNWTTTTLSSLDLSFVEGESVTIQATMSDDSGSFSSYYISSSDGSFTGYDYNISGTSYELTFTPSDGVTYTLTFNGTVSYESVTIGVKGEDSSISGVNSSGLPHDSNGDYVGEAVGTYKITKANGWSLTVEGLTYQYYDANTELHTYYYYFVETAVDGYYTTYSSSLGTTDGGSLTITNTQIPTTDVSVEKEWCDQNGDEKSDTSSLDSITVDLYRTEVAASGDDSSNTTDTITVTVNYSTDYSYGNVITKEVPINTSFTITMTPYNEYYGPYGTTSCYVGLGSYAGEWLTFTSNELSIEANYVTQDITFNIAVVSDVSISYTGESTGSSSDTLYYSADLPTDGTYIGSYTLSYGNSWTQTIADLPGAYVDEDGTLHYYYYYFRESAIMYYDTTYSTSSGIQSGTVTITNTYNPNRKYTSAKVSKVWEDSTGVSLSESSLTNASAQFQLWQVLMASDETYLTDSDGATLVIPYGSPVTLSSSTGWSNTWVPLPATTTYNNTEYTCLYLITEVSASTGTTATYTTSYGTSSETAASDIGSITVDGVTYYVVTVGENSENSDAPVITITNTTSEEEEEGSTSITVTKAWSNVADVNLDGYTVTFQLVQRLKASDDTYYTTGGEEVTDYSTKNVDGNPISYSYDMAITGSDSGSYTWSSLPVTVTIDSVTYTCEYYLVESAVKDSSGNSVADQYTVTYSNSSATTYTDATNVTYYQVTNGGTATVTNTYSKEEETTISFTVTKKWEENGSSLQVSEVTLTVQLLQVLTAKGYDTLYNKSDTSDIDDYTQTITFTNSSTEEVTWSSLPATMTISGVKYTCSYYITEASVVNGSGTPVANLYTVAYANGSATATSYEYTDTSTNETTTYYAVSDGETITITNTAKNTAVLPSTGGSGSNGKLVLLGSSIALLALMLILARRRKREVVG